MSGLPEAVRNTKPSWGFKIPFILANLMALFLLFNITFFWGDEIVLQLTGKESMAEHTMRATVFVMCVFRVVGHIAWALFLCPYSFPLWLSAGVAGFSFLFDAVGILAVLWNRTEYSMVWDNIGLCIFFLGQFVERVSELDRVVFKTRPGNAGKMHIVGFYKYLVHPNYFGFLVKQLCFLSFSWVWPLVVLLGAMNIADFVYGDIRKQRARNIARYGDEFKRYWDDTYKLIPGVY